MFENEERWRLCSVYVLALPDGRPRNVLFVYNRSASMTRCSWRSSIASSSCPLALAPACAWAPALRRCCHVRCRVLTFSCRKQHRSRFMLFGAGPCMCLGVAFAQCAFKQFDWHRDRRKAPEECPRESWQNSNLWYANLQLCPHKVRQAILNVSLMAVHPQMCIAVMRADVSDDDGGDAAASLPL